MERLCWGIAGIRLKSSELSLHRKRMSRLGPVSGSNSWLRDQILAICSDLVINVYSRIVML